MEQPLEFVTITNPSEIKDPQKQKAIRRKARRRENDPKSSSRKPFRMTFDLPSREMSAGSEQLIVGGPKTSSQFSLSEPDYSNLDTMAQTCMFFEAEDTRGGLGFKSPFSPGLMTRAVQLANYIRGGTDGDFCPLMNYWWSIGQLDSTAFLVTLANASRVINQRYPDEPKESPEAVELYTRSIQCLQQRLQTSSPRPSEGIIITVLEMAYYDFLVQDLARWLIHMAGLVNIIRRRGGIQTLRSSEMVILLSFWIDVSGSFIFDSAPFFPSPHHLLTHTPLRARASPTLDKWNETFPESSDITDFLCQAKSLTYYIDERATSSEIWKDDRFLSRTFNGVVHQLLSLGRNSGGMHKSAPPPQFVMRESMRRACLILFGLLRHMFSVRPSGVTQHKNGVKELLVQHPIDWSGFLDIKLWVLLTASLAAENEELPWYIEEIKGIMVQMELSDWNGLVEVARSILWMEETFRVKIDRLKELLELPAED